MASANLVDQPHFPPPPPHRPPPSPSPDNHTTLIVILFVSFGCLLFLAFFTFVLCCLIKKKHKKSVQETETVRVDEHLKVNEAIVQGPHGPPHAVVLSVEDDVRIEDEIKKNEKFGNDMQPKGSQEGQQNDDHHRRHHSSSV